MWRTVRSIRDLVANDVRMKVEQALHAVSMDSYVERNSFHLSGGEKKRVSIATVLSMQPQILVIDEPTSGLDPRSRRELITLLQELPQTMVIATHDLAMVKTLTPRTILLDLGKNCRGWGDGGYPWQ